MFPETSQLCDDNLELANVKSRNDFIEESVKFYVGYLNTKHNSSFLNETIESVIKSSLRLMEDRLAKFLFELTVETIMIVSIIGAIFEDRRVRIRAYRTQLFVLD